MRRAAYHQRRVPFTWSGSGSDCEGRQISSSTGVVSDWLDFPLMPSRLATHRRCLGQPPPAAAIDQALAQPLDAPMQHRGPRHEDDEHCPRKLRVESPPSRPQPPPAPSSAASGWRPPGGRQSGGARRPCPPANWRRAIRASLATLDRGVDRPHRRAARRIRRFRGLPCNANPVRN